MVNMVEVDRLKVAIRKADALDRWDMSQWANGVAKPEAKDPWDCGAAFCAAGWVTVINGYLPAYEMGSRYDEATDKYVAAPNVLSDVFVPKGAERDYDSPNFDWELTTDARTKASEILDITDGQARMLFVESERMESVEAYFELIDHVISSEEFDRDEAYYIIEKG